MGITFFDSMLGGLFDWVTVTTMQAFGEVPAQTTLVIRYKPPTGYVLYTGVDCFGDLPNGVFTMTIYIDGHIVFDGIYLTTALLNKMFVPFPAVPVRDVLEVHITNTDTASHYLDFIKLAILVPLEREKEVIEMSSTKAIVDLLKEILNKLRR